MYVWFESEMVLITNVELHAEMVELGAEDEIYSIKHMTRKLEKRYGKPNIVCFRNGADYIIAKSLKEQEMQKPQNVNDSSKQQQN